MKVVALAGGVGGAKLADGLARILPSDDLCVVVNTGDDFDHFGLRICPDLDTVCYTLAGLANPETGWGRAEESWNAMQALAELGGPDWFRLGDLDLATHLERTRLLQAGLTLSQVTARFCQVWSLRQTILPMSDDPVATRVCTEQGELGFQEYFVHQRCQPRVTGFRFEQAKDARPAPGVLEALENAQLILICPSNPWVSVDPILSIPGIREELTGEALHSRVILAVSPIIRGATLKGPAAKMFAELGIEPSALAVAEHYGAVRKGGILNGFIVDQLDLELVDQVEGFGIRSRPLDTWMKTIQDRQRLAEQVLEWAKILLEKDEPQSPGSPSKRGIK
jgi:LPPG:FO 2-phospho-L-lactate transferase